MHNFARLFVVKIFGFVEWFVGSEDVEHTSLFGVLYSVVYVGDDLFEIRGTLLGAVGVEEALFRREFCKFSVLSFVKNVKVQFFPVHS